VILFNNSIYLENFGECGGQGRCATYLVKAVGLKGNANKMGRNEAVLLVKQDYLMRDSVCLVSYS